MDLRHFDQARRPQVSTRSNDNTIAQCPLDAAGRKSLKHVQGMFRRLCNRKDNAQAYGRAMLDLPHHHSAQKDRLQTITLAWEMDL